MDSYIKKQRALTSGMIGAIVASQVFSYGHQLPFPATLGILSISIFAYGLLAANTVLKFNGNETNAVMRQRAKDITPTLHALRCATVLQGAALIHSGLSPDGPMFEGAFSIMLLYGAMKLMQAEREFWEKYQESPTLKY